jgi:hypothetical protein
MRNMYKILVGKSEGRPFRRPRHRLKDANNIQMDLGETGLEGVDLIHVIGIGNISGLL